MTYAETIAITMTHAETIAITMTTAETMAITMTYARKTRTALELMSIILVGTYTELMIK